MLIKLLLYANPIINVCQGFHCLLLQIAIENFDIFFIQLAFIEKFKWHNVGLFVRKPVFRVLQTTKAQYVYFDSIHPSQQSLVMWGRVFLVWTSTKQRIRCLAQGNNAVSAAGEARTHNPSISSQALYHWVTALLIFSRSLVKSVYKKFNFLISKPKHM